MRQNIINDICFTENNLNINCSYVINKIKLKSKENIIDLSLKNNKLDIIDFIKNYNNISNNIKKYVLCDENENAITIGSLKRNKSSILCKNLELEYEGNIYIVNIYINTNNHLVIKLIDIYEGKLNVEYDNIFVQENILNIRLNSYVYKRNNEDKLEKEFYVAKQSSLLFVNEDGENVFEFTPETTFNNKMTYKIDLKIFLKEENCKLKFVTKLDYNEVEIVVPYKSKFEKIILNKDDLVKVVSIYSNETLKIKSNLELLLSPTLYELNYDNGLKISGKLNPNIDIFNCKSINTKLVLISKDNKSIAEFDADIKDTEFNVFIKKEELELIKDEYQGRWQMFIRVDYNEEELAQNEMLNNEYTAKQIIEEKLEFEEQSINLNTTIKDDKTYIILKNDLIIKKLVNVIRKNNNLKVRFKFNQNIEELVDENKLIVNISTPNERLTQLNIKKKGKKSIRVEYQAKDGLKFTQEMYEKGITAKISANDIKSKSTVSDIDKDSIYHNLKQHVQASKKYKKIVRKLYNKVLTKLPIKKNWVVYESFLGRNMSDSPKYIYEYLKETHTNKYKHIWVFNQERDDLPSDVVQVKRFSFSHLYYIARSKFWVNNMRQPKWFIKRKDQVFLATWHGTPLKKLVFDMDEVHSANKNYKEDFYIQSRSWDYLISANKYSTEIFRRAFRFDNPILELGYPRNDLLYSPKKEEMAREIKEKLGIPLDKKIVLYAPTWRDDEFFKPGKYKFNLELDLRRLREELGDQYYFVLRTHYFIANHIDVDGLEDFVYNASTYDDITELYLLSDVLITDYSSVFFDYANLNRPTLFFTYDLEKYRDTLRGFYLDLQTEGPGPIVMTNDDIINELKDFNELTNKYKDRIEAFHERFCTWDDGYAAKRIAEEVIVKNS